MIIVLKLQGGTTTMFTVNNNIKINIDYYHKVTVRREFLQFTYSKSKTVCSEDHKRWWVAKKLAFFECWDLRRRNLGCDFQY